MTTVYATHPRYTDHDFPGHPERADRIRAVWRGIDESGLGDRMVHLPVSEIDVHAILSVHTADHLDLLRTVSAAHRTTFLDPDTYAGPDALTIAMLSAGAVVGAVDAVLAGTAVNGIAAARPPGHHALGDRAMGFCLLGNVAIATRHAQAAYGIERVLIVDYDVHHGNGTEAMFYDDPSVLYVSTHQSPFYPGTGAATDIGTGPGEGFTLNIPLPGGSGDRTYAKVFDDVVWAAAERFRPQLVIASVGFDAFWADPLADMRLTLTGYSRIAAEVIAMAQRFCDGRVVFALEGGYDLEALRHGMGNIARQLLGDEVVDPLGAPGTADAVDVSPLIAQLRSVHAL